MNENHENCLDVHVIDLFYFFVPIFCYSFDASMCNRSNYVIHNM